MMAVGALFEGFGLGFIAREARGQAKKIEAFVKRPRTLYAHSSFHGVSSVEVGRMTGGPEPTNGERVRLVEDAVSNLKNEVQEIDARLREQWQNDLGQTEQRIEMALNDYKADLEKLVTDAPTKLRLWGVGLFVTGLALQTGGNVLSMVRSG